MNCAHRVGMLWVARLFALSMVVGFIPSNAMAGDPAGFEYAFTAGQNSGAFETDSDFNIGGTLSVPVFGADPLFGQVLMGEILLGYSETHDDGTFNAPIVTVLGVPAEPTPATKFTLTTFQVGAGVKYKFTFLPTMGFLQIQPYLSAGAAFNVFLSRTDGDNGDRAGGIAPISPELDDRGVPVGQGNVLVGGTYGAGVDFVLFKNVLIGIDARKTAISDKGADFTTVAAKVGFRF